MPALDRPTNFLDTFTVLFTFQSKTSPLLIRLDGKFGGKINFENGNTNICIFYRVKGKMVTTLQKRFINGGGGGNDVGGKRWKLPLKIDSNNGEEQREL